MLRVPRLWSGGALIHTSLSKVAPPCTREETSHASIEQNQSSTLSSLLRTPPSDLPLIHCLGFPTTSHAADSWKSSRSNDGPSAFQAMQKEASREICRHGSQNHISSRICCSAPNSNWQCFSPAASSLVEECHQFATAVNLPEATRILAIHWA